MKDFVVYQPLTECPIIWIADITNGINLDVYCVYPHTTGE